MKELLEAFKKGMSIGIRGTVNGDILICIYRPGDPGCEQEIKIDSVAFLNAYTWLDGFRDRIEGWIKHPIFGPFIKGFLK